MTLNLFDDSDFQAPLDARMGEQAWVLRGFAQPLMPAILHHLALVIAAAPLRHMVTPGGHTMSVASTNCGQLGWTTDHRGYRYGADDPLTGTPWPAMPDVFIELAAAAADRAGFPAFVPDACLVNRYDVGAKMSLHQDKNERDLTAPIVSVSLGMPAVFLFGGMTRSAPAQRYPLYHGDVAVWGGADRLRFHGVLPVKAQAQAPAGLGADLGECRINLTFRQAGSDQ